MSLTRIPRMEPNVTFLFLGTFSYGERSFPGPGLLDGSERRIRVGILWLFCRLVLLKFGS
jgi:hypothetical protein